jgi:hypothetical protein
LLSVIDSTEEGRAIDEEQHKHLREELIKTNEFWKRLKVEMRAGVREANRKMIIDPSRHSSTDSTQPAKSSPTR